MEPRSWLLPSTPVPAALRAVTPWAWWLPGVDGALSWLSERSLHQGMRIALAGANTPACAALLQAAPLRGITTVLINRRLSRAEQLGQLQRSACSAVLAAPGSALDEAAGVAVHQLPDAVQPAAAIPQPTPLDDAQAALVVYSSGTTGPAKAVRLSLGALRLAAAAAVERLQLRSDDEWLGCLPLDHIGGASLVYRAGLCGYALCLLERFDAVAADRLLDAGTTGISVVPTMLHRLVAGRAGRPFAPRLRILLTGGGPLARDLALHARALGLPPLETYGLTEAASQVCTPERDRPVAPGSCGRPLPGMQVRIRREDGTACAPGERGTIEICSPALFAGYEEGGRLTIPHPHGAWFATSDLGSLDADGQLSVHGRRDEVIISGGEKIDPAEVEEVLERHPAISEAGVHGVADAHWGQAVAALLVPGGERPDDSELSAWMAQALSGFKRPRSWRWVDRLPRTATGKLQRHRLAGWEG